MTQSGHPSFQNPDGDDYFIGQQDRRGGDRQASEERLARAFVAGENVPFSFGDNPSNLACRVCAPCQEALRFGLLIFLLCLVPPFFERRHKKHRRRSRPRLAPLSARPMWMISSALERPCRSN